MTITVQFTVAMDSEQKQLGNAKEIKFECDFDGVDPGIIQRHAIQNMIVTWQGQIRRNWGLFLEGKLPKVVLFGAALFPGRTRGVAPPMTTERAEEFILSQDRLTQVRTAITLMEKVGMEVPEELLEEESQLISVKKQSESFIEAHDL